MMPQTQLSAEERIRKVRIKFLRKKPFFAHLALHFNLIEDKRVEMMGIDAEGNLVYNPDFVNKYCFRDLEMIIAHETLHMAFMHLLRRGNRIPELWNISADFAVNNILYDDKFSIPSEFLMNRDYKNMTAEQIYDLLYKNATKMNISAGKICKKGADGMEEVSGQGKRFDKHIFPKSQNGNGKGKKDDEGKEMSEEDLKKLQDLWKRRITEAEAVARQRGNLPSNIARMLGTIMESKMNWKALLYRYITQEIPMDSSYARPSKRSHSIGIYLPYQIKENIDVVVVIDDSGSISEKELGEFMSEIIAISKSFASIKITALTCDTEVHEVYEVRNGFSPEDIKVSGGGGTDVTNAVKWIEKNKPYTKLWIYLTDGYTELRGSNPFNSLWVISENGSVSDAEKIAGRAGNITCIKIGE